MSTTSKAGFTIIETMLFLAITGLLIAGMLVGVGTSINVQRYRDSVISLKSLLQDQYSQINSVNNDRDGTWSCDAAAQTSQGSAPEARGQSDCVILGRYVTIVDNDITVVPVTGAQSSVVTGNDVYILKNGYKLGLWAAGEQKSTLDWGTKIAWPVSGGGSASHAVGSSRSIAILMVRSPDSGSVYTFTSDTIPTDDSISKGGLSGMLVSADAIPGQGERTICVDPNGLVITQRQAVFIHSFATNDSAIESRSNDVIQSLGGDTKC